MSKSTYILVILCNQDVEALPFRVWIGVMIFFTTFTNYMLRSNMSVSIIKMVGEKDSKFIPVCLRNHSDTTTTRSTTATTQQQAQFDWDENQVGDIMAGYFYGYLVSLVPAGVLSELIGPWHVIFWSNLASAVLTGLTPLATNAGHFGVMMTRILVGVLGGVVYPAANTLIARWAPPEEKGKFMAAMTGNNLGTVFAFNLVGVVTDYWGWPWGFYVLVLVVGIFCTAFFFVVSDSPSASKWTSQEESDFILASQEGHLSKKKTIPPYRKMLSSVPFWATTTAQFGNLWGLNLILSYSPKFLAETIGFQLKASAGLAALPYVARMSCSASFGVIGDICRKRNVSVTRIRKFFIIFSHFLPAVCFFLMKTAGCNAAGVVTLLVANQGFNGASVVSQLVNPQDLAPNFAGSCFGVMNVISMTTGIFVPKLTGALNDYYHKDLTGAALIFMIGGIVYSVTGAAFIIFGSGKVQPWNEIKEKEEPTTQEQT